MRVVGTAKASGLGPLLFACYRQWFQCAGVNIYRRKIQQSNDLPQIQASLVSTALREERLCESFYAQFAVQPARLIELAWFDSHRHVR